MFSIIVQKTSRSLFIFINLSKYYYSSFFSLFVSFLLGKLLGSRTTEIMYMITITFTKKTAKNAEYVVAFSCP